MIGSLRGTVLDRTLGVSAGEVLIDVGGVGYRVSVPATTLTLAELATPLFLHVHTHVRDDAIILYGFASADERVCFESLISVHGVGPALALALLSTHSPMALRRIVLDEDADALTLVPGVGKKTATRLLLELQAKLDLSRPEERGLGAGGGGSAPGSGPAAPPAARAEVRAALAGLGYGPEDVREVMRDLPEDGDTAQLVRLALRQLAGSR
jgi:Holliday junction DNA helicase RuvA